MEKMDRLVIEKLAGRLEAVYGQPATGVLWFDEELRRIDFYEGVFAVTVKPAPTFSKRNSGLVFTLSSLRLHNEGRYTQGGLCPCGLCGGTILNRN